MCFLGPRTCGRQADVSSRQQAGVSGGCDVQPDGCSAACARPALPAGCGCRPRELRIAAMRLHSLLLLLLLVRCGRRRCAAQVGGLLHAGCHQLVLKHRSRAVSRARITSPASPRAQQPLRCCIAILLLLEAGWCAWQGPSRLRVCADTTLSHYTARTLPHAPQEQHPEKLDAPSWRKPHRRQSRTGQMWKGPLHMVVRTEEP
jgi:hypothetical protein